MAILIISPDPDFSATVAEQAAHALGEECCVAENIESAQSFMAQAALVVTAWAVVAQAPCPVIAVEHPPVRLRDLLAQMQAMLHKPSETLDLGRGFGLQPRQKRLTNGGATVGLTDKEAQLLAALAEAGGAGAGRERLLKEVWGIEAALDTHTLETHIYRLRGKFKELSDEDGIVATEGGYGLKRG